MSGARTSVGLPRGSFCLEGQQDPPFGLLNINQIQNQQVKNPQDQHGEDELHFIRNQLEDENSGLRIEVIRLQEELSEAKVQNGALT